MTPTTKVAALLLLGTSIGLGGCATYGESGWGVRTWQSESEGTIFREAPLERIRVTRGHTVYRLEGGRLAADSLIGFQEEDDGWRRVALHRDQLDRLEVKKLNREMTVIIGGISAALLVVGVLAGP